MCEDKTLWIVGLSDSAEISSEDMSWTDLASHLKNKKLRIIKMQLRFRDHVVNMPDNALGYYFSRACSGGLGIDHSFNFYITGILNDRDRVERIWFYVPELEVHQKDEKDRDKVIQECLIENQLNLGPQKSPSSVYKISAENRAIIKEIKNL